MDQGSVWPALAAAVLEGIPKGESKRAAKKAGRVKRGGGRCEGRRDHRPFGIIHGSVVYCRNAWRWEWDGRSVVTVSLGEFSGRPARF